jgi:hypothetical protein
MRALLDDKKGRIRLLWSSLALLVWGAVGAAIWALLDWCDDQLYPWANYLNSLAPAHARVTWLASSNIRNALGVVEWILYVLVVGKLIVLGTASAQWGLRLPVRRLMRVLLDWRWWLAVVLVGLASKFTPALFFSGTPSGPPAGQVMMVAAGVVTVFLVLAAGWVLLLGWAAVLLGRAEPPTEEVLVPVPVLAGPEDKSRSAAVDVPPPDHEGQA